MENEKLGLLKKSTAETRERVRQAAVSLERNWFDHLLQYCRGERASNALQAIGEAPFFQNVPLEAKQGLVEGYPEHNGWQALRGLHHLNRRSRRRLHESDKWIVHLFAGKESREEYKYLERHGYVVLELDLERGATHDVLSPAVWRALEWAARSGKIAGIIGGPPCRSYSMLRYQRPGPSPVRTNAYPYGGWPGQPAAEEELAVKDTSLFVRMIYLHALATAGRVIAQPGPEQQREVSFLLEQPQDPREFLRWDHELYDEVVSFWRSDLWIGYANEAGLARYSVDQGAVGHFARKPTSLGTNLTMLSSLDGLKAEGYFDPWQGSSRDLAKWGPGLVEAIVKAIIVHRSIPRMLAMSAEQWADHVRRGHLPFRRDCMTCVQAGATGRRHSRVEHPDAFVMTADLSGPLKEHGLDSHGRGRAPAKFRYLFVAKLRVPKDFVDDGRGVGLDYIPGDDPLHEPVPPDDGLEEEHGGEQRVSGEVEAGEVEENGEKEEDEPERKRPKEDLGEDLKPPDMVNLIFATGLHDNKSATVLEAIQDVVLYARSYNIPILRFHCDRSMEFFAKNSRQWIKEQGMRMTSSEGGEHQSNGAAENTVKWIKQRARTLLAGASLPQRLWPYAADYAATMQRSSVLGFEAKLAAPFGAKVLIKKKPYIGSGHGGKMDDLAPRWEEGSYLGLSNAVRQGHLVYINNEGERFLHTAHVRPGLHDPGPPTESVEAEESSSARRRLRAKTSIRSMTSMAQMDQSLAEKELEKEVERVLGEWNREEAEELVVQACSILPRTANKYGLFRHGGVMGLTKATYDRPWMARLLVKLLQDVDPDAEFASVYVSLDGEKALHRDSHNEAGSLNYLYPVKLPRRGGDLWMELCEGDVVTGSIMELQDNKGKMYYGNVIPLLEGQVRTINPRKRHAVLPWKGKPGERIVVIGYTPARVGKISSAEREQLSVLGFCPPTLTYDDSVAVRALRVKAVDKSIVEEEPEALSGGGWTERVETSDGILLFVVDWKLSRERPPNHPVSNDGAGVVQSKDPEECMAEEMYVVTSDQKARIPLMMSIEAMGSSPVAVRKTEVNYTRNIEELLASLKEPLAVVHTVHPSEVAPNLENWKPSMIKELNAIGHAVIRLKKGDPLREVWMEKKGMQMLPMKLVYTVKPPDAAPLVEGDAWFKRKVRAVICGNMAGDSDLEVYTGAAPAEVVRAALSIASKFGWSAAVLDVISAFLQTPLDEIPNAPIVIAVPPRALVQAQLAEEGELWGITHAVYGLRESPRLWGIFRDGEMRKLKTTLNDKEIVLVQGHIEPTWWAIKMEGCTIGILVIYVDDYLILAFPDVITVVSNAVQRVWKTSALQVASALNPIRFLGMEIHVTTRGFTISQRPYIRELLRLHEIGSQRLDVVPVNREIGSFEASPEEGVFSQEELKFAQQCAGEILWLSQRSRPDWGYVASLLSSLTTKAPRRVAEITMKVLGYLQRTMEYALFLEADSTGLVSYADSSFAPSGARSHTGWVTMLFGAPISWRSSRQSTTSLSTGEAELNAAVEGALALMSSQALLTDVMANPVDLVLETDSTTALSLAEGSGSWRTRQDQGELVVRAHKGRTSEDGASKWRDTTCRCSD